jgi:hypothetical protein
VLDMLLAATEIVTNADEHGGGLKDVRVAPRRANHRRALCG